MNRRKVLLGALALLVCLTTSAGAQTVEETILAAFARVSDAELESDARVLCGLEPYDGELIANRRVCNPLHDLTTDYLVERFETMGFSAWREEFTCGAYTCTNVVAQLDGEQTPERIWVVGGHYDDVGSGGQGAVDNASGVIIVLQTLNALREYGFRDSLRFILFDGEEIGLLGSYYHAQRARARGLRLSDRRRQGGSCPRPACRYRGGRRRPRRRCRQTGRTSCCPAQRSAGNVGPAQLRQLPHLPLLRPGRR